MYGNPNQNMDDMFLIQIIYIIFQEVSLRWYFSDNHHLLALDGHGSHVSLK
jgi:hypothetical protein